MTIGSRSGHWEGSDLAPSELGQGPLGFPSLLDPLFIFVILNSASRN